MERGDTNFAMNELFPSCGTGNDDGFISLGSILRTYNAPITEDHAWALCYSCVRSLDQTETSAYFWREQMEGIDLVKVSSEGQLHFDIFPIPDGKEIGEQGNGTLITEAALITKLAVIIYKALDFALKEDEERSLGSDLEHLLEKMISSDNNKILLTFEDIVEACEVHFNMKFSTELALDSMKLCKNICKDLVNDALEFSKFVRIADYASRALESMTWNMEEKGLKKSPRSPDMPHIFQKSRGENFKAVAHLWIQVVREFREGGIHLKMQNESRLGSRREYKKTPYEQLMDDIKTGRYNLRKVPEHKVARSRMGPPTSHDILMEYIRSRPKLRKVTEHLMNRPARKKSLNPFDELMQSIRQSGDYHGLKPAMPN